MQQLRSVAVEVAAIAPIHISIILQQAADNGRLKMLLTCGCDGSTVDLALCEARAALLYSLPHHVCEAAAYEAMAACPEHIAIILRAAAQAPGAFKKLFSC